MSTEKVLLGTLAGIVTGAVLGVLFAPDCGSATRKKISQKGADYSDELYTKFGDYVGGITKKMVGLKNEATDMVEKGSAKVGAAFAEATTNGSPKIHESNVPVHQKSY